MLRPKITSSSRIQPGNFETCLKMDAVDPDVDLALRRQIALPPRGVFVKPTVLQAADGGCRQIAGIGVDDAAWGRWVFSKNRNRLLEGGKRKADTLGSEFE